MTAWKSTRTVLVRRHRLVHPAVDHSALSYTSLLAAYSFLSCLKKQDLHISVSFFGFWFLHRSIILAFG